MYDQSLEDLIQAALADGVITDQEWSVIYGKAKQFGIDKDEIEVYVEGLLTRQRKSNKLGTVRKCPACGADIAAFQTHCPECGHQFRNVEVSDALHRFEQQYRSIVAKSSDSDEEEKANSKRISLVSSFAIPNTEEDLTEFSAIASTETSKAPLFSSAWLMVTAFVLGLTALLCLLMSFDSRNSVSYLVDISTGAIFYGLFAIGAAAVFGGKKIKRKYELASAWGCKLNQVKIKANALRNPRPEFIKLVNKNVKSYNRRKSIPYFILIVELFLLGVAFIIPVITVYPNDSGNSIQVEEVKTNDSITDKESVHDNSVDDTNAIEEIDDSQLHKASEAEEMMEKMENHVIDLCMDGEYEKAQQYIEENIDYFDAVANNAYFPYTKQEVKSKLIDCISMIKE